MAQSRNLVPWTIIGGLLALIMPITGTAIAGLLFPEFRWTHLPLHSLVEGCGGLIALAIAGILLVQLGHKSDTEHYSWMAAGLLGMGVLDSFHAAASFGNHFVWLHSTASFVGGVLFAPVWVGKRVPRFFSGHRFPAVVAIVSVAVGGASLLMPSLLPAMTTSTGTFSTTALTFNVIGGMGFLIAAAFFVRRFMATGNVEDWTFGVHTSLFGAAGVLFAYSVVWDGSWWWWHLLRLAAYVAALSYGLRTFRDAERELRRVNRQLSQTNDALRRDRTLLEAIHFAQTQCITAESPLTVFDDFLKHILFLSESPVGFIDEVIFSPDGQPVLTAQAHADLSWNEESRGIYQQSPNGTLNFSTLKSICEEVMKSATPLIANAVPHGQRSADIAAERPPLNSFLGLPMQSSLREFVGLIGLANRPGGYTEEVISQLHPIVLACANLIAARKNDQRRKQAELELKRLNEQLNAANAALDRTVEERTAKLRASEERFELAVRGSTDGLWDWNVLTNTVFYSPRMKELLGYSDDEFPHVFASFESRLHPDDHNWVLRAVDEHLSQRTPYDVEYRLQTRSGEYRWFRARGQAIWNDAGQAERMAGSITDVTESHRLQERFRLAVEASPAALIMVHQDGRILMANSRSLTSFGYSAAELIGQPIEILVPERFRAAHPAHRAQFFKTPAQRAMGDDLELLGVRKDGSEFPVKVGLSPVETAEGQAVICGVLDITDQIKTLEAMRQAKEAAESASRAKSSFLANMSHEIRTPMNGIIGMAQLLAQTELRSHQRDYLVTIVESAHILLRLLNDILDFSKIEAGKLELERVDFRVWECVARASQMLVLRAAEKGLEIVCRVAPEIPEHLRGDPGRLQQVLVNLLGNAVKFTEVGEILVNVDAQSLSPDQCRLHFFVSDTGIGIPADKQEQVFHPFEQAESSTIRRFGGTGLGLTISRQLVEMMGGRLWVESIPGRGSTFHFTAEFEVSADQPLTQPANLDALRDLPVLVVDDNFTNRRILSEMLQCWHMQPVLADSAAAARQALHAADQSQRPIRLILLDHHMPGEDGFDFLESVRDMLQRVQCTVIMISSGAFPIDADLCQKYGIARFITKPVIASELLNEVLCQLGRYTTVKPIEPQSVAAASPVEPRRVLLVEDNEINRRVALGMLQSRGHQVEVAVNGLEAVRTLAERDFDVVLMDMQMPVMDGYEATAAIRKRQQQTAGRTPIVAMTAEALKGDRERCLAAGMDDYVPKPIAPAELYRVVERFPARCVSADSARQNISDSRPAPTTGDIELQDPVAGMDAARDTRPAIDWKVANERLGRRAELLCELSELAKTETPKLLADIRRAVETRDAKLLQRSAHTLKGAVSYFAAEPLYQVALALEIVGRSESFDGTTEMLVTLEQEFARVWAALEAGPPESIF